MPLVRGDDECKLSIFVYREHPVQKIPRFFRAEVDGVIDRLRFSRHLRFRFCWQWFCLSFQYRQRCDYRFCRSRVFRRRCFYLWLFGLCFLDLVGIWTMSFGASFSRATADQYQENDH